MLHKFFLLVMIFALVSCASKDEKEERKQNAFDVSGNYLGEFTNKSFQENSNFTLRIDNEVGRHDIVAIMKRSHALTEKEKRFLIDKHGLDPKLVADKFGERFIIGKGESGSLEGGENISDDFGESSRLLICTERAQLNAQYTAHYCLQGTITKSDYILRGTLSLHLEKEVRSRGSDGREVVEYQFDNSDLSYEADPGRPFYTQYLGAWSGVITPSFEVKDDLSAFNTINIITDNEFFLVEPRVASLKFEGEVFEYSKIRLPMRNLELLKVPLVEMQFKSRNGKALVLYGQIYSLGNLRGSIVYYLNNQSDPHQIASFDLKKI